jgi:hypothetical protein
MFLNVTKKRRLNATLCSLPNIMYIDIPIIHTHRQTIPKAKLIARFTQLLLDVDPVPPVTYPEEQRVQEVAPTTEE